MPGLREKFEGCMAGSWVGSAMGAPVEGASREAVREAHGYVDRLLPYGYDDWKRPPGTTEDGIERQRLIATAIIEKQDRILPHDLVAVWLRDLDPEKMKRKQEAFDWSLLGMARAGVPPVELGRLWPFPNVVSFARCCHPLGLINAGDPQGAADDALTVGQVYMTAISFGLRWAALYVAAIAEACRPGATVESVLEVAHQYAGYRAEAGSLYALYDTVEHEVSHALELARRHSDPMAMRDEFYQTYFGGDYFNYGQSQANEIVAKGLAVFALARGNPKEAILAAVNFGRDTDCLAAIAGGLSGALNGPEALPAEWIDQVNQATQKDPYTNSKRTIQQTAEKLYAAFEARRKKLHGYLELMGGT